MLDTRRMLVKSLAAAVCCTLLSSAPACSQDQPAQVRQYKGNLHTHSLWSDGDDYPEMIAKWYRDHGYQFLTFTDHNILQLRDRWTDVEKNKGGRAAYDKVKKTFPDWIDERTREGRLEVRLKRFAETSERFEKPGEFLLLHGEEISDAFGNKPLHLNVSNIKELIPRMGGKSVLEVLQNNVNAVNRQRERTGQPMMVHVNHPNFGYAVSERDLMQLKGERFFEVYNGHPSVRNKGDKQHLGTERMWDVINTMRLGALKLPVMYGIAVDDGHHYHKFETRKSNPGRGWVMVMAEELSPGAIIRSMEAGTFYASSGVTLKSITSSNEELTVELPPAQDGVSYTVEFIGTMKEDTPSRDVVAKGGEWGDEIGKVFNTVIAPSGKLTYRFDGNELYVRARITSSRKQSNPGEAGDLERAWTQPVAP